MANKKPKANQKSARLSRSTRDMVLLTGNPVWRAFAKKPVSEETQVTIGLAGRKALYALTNGLGRFEHFNELVVTGYAAVSLAERGYGADLLADFNAALGVVLSCRIRALKEQKYLLSQKDAQLVSVLLDLHEQQVQLAGKAELATAIVDGFKRANVASCH
jgi:hypothetical protein